MRGTEFEFIHITILIAAQRETANLLSFIYGDHFAVKSKFSGVFKPDELDLGSKLPTNGRVLP
jgi:hypothetical protein